MPLTPPNHGLRDASPLFSTPGDIGDGANADDPYTKWCVNAELFPATVCRLQEAGFVSLKSVRQLTSQMIESEFGDLKLAQKLLLDAAVAELNTAHVRRAETGCLPLNRNKNSSDIQNGGQTASNQQDDGSALLQNKLDAGSNLSVHDMMSLWNQPASTQPPTMSTAEQQSQSTGKTLVFDPFAQPPESASGPHRDICNYVSLATRDRRKESGGLTMGDFELSLTDGKVSLNNKKVELGKLTQVQYMEASLKILREMVYKDKISVSQIMDYVGYVTKIVTLAQTFQWASVLLYDREYRLVQAEKGFAWGADNSYLMQLLLRPMGQMTSNNAGLQNGSTRVTDRPRTRYEPGSGRPICEKWNGRWGCSLKNCRYAHVCLSCYTTAHNDINHSTSRNQTSGGNFTAQGKGGRSDAAGQNYQQTEGPKNWWG
jgi:hypothetical protein